ncbi:hypothetical protein [Actinomadura nitritigenes]|uniref:hypothetical protein n=1 Tax=Actinomadura nitritigenes TaxID=134602 RepID=UPI003D8E8695
MLYKTAMGTVLDTLFSTHADTAAVETVHRSVETILDHLFRRMFLPQPPRRLPTMVHRPFDRALADLKHSVAVIIAAYRSDGGDHADLLSTMLATQRQGDGGLSDTEIARTGPDDAGGRRRSRGFHAVLGVVAASRASRGRREDTPRRRRRVRGTVGA